MLLRPVIKFGLFEFDPAAGLLYQGDEETLLPPKGAGVLHVLLQNAGELVTKDTLLEEVWAGAFVTESSLTDAISLLRQVLGDDSRDPTYIQTLHRRGYRFIAPVEQSASENGSADGVAGGVGGAEHEEGAAIPAVEPAGETGVRHAGGWAVGDRLGSFEILEPLGAGAMGTVYRAHDESLEREVAIKVLPADFTDSPDRVERLEREAKLLASVSHPNIATIHSLEESDGIRYPVFELVEGETLEQRLRSGRLPVDEALEIGRQIASALESAHERGIIHRDLKPANIKVTPEGQVKVLDFGLAKALEVEVFGGATNSQPTESIAVKGSRRGSIVGTASYMSPEQARGQEVDKRADIWSFGSVVYELLTGRRPFEGQTVSDTIAGVLEREPDWGALPSETPALVRSLLRRVLQKDPANRLHHIADARIEIEEAVSEPEAALPGFAPGETRSPLWQRALPWTVAGIAIVALAGSLAVWIFSSPPRKIRRFEILLEEGLRLSGGHPVEAERFAFLRPSRTAMALSPDGRYLVYGATDGETTQLYRRAVDERQATPIAGTEDGTRPFFSPDGQWVGFAFWGGGEMGLKRVPLMGGDVQTLSASHQGIPCGASWGEDDNIYYTCGAGAVGRTPWTGGQGHQHLTEVDKEAGEWRHCSPQLLPGGNAILYLVQTAPWAWDEAEIVVQSLVTGQRTTLVTGGSDPRYLPTGHLVYAFGGALMARTFDPMSLSLGDPVRVLDDVMQSVAVASVPKNSGHAQFSVSASGDMVYVPGGVYPENDNPIVWLDREGRATPIDLPAGDKVYPRLSPDGRYLAYTTGALNKQSIWIHDIQRGIDRRLTDEEDETDGFFSFAWSPDGEEIAYSARGESTFDNIYVRNVDGSGGARQLTTGSDHVKWVGWWPTDDTLVFYTFPPGADIRLLRMGGGGEPEVELFLDLRAPVEHLAVSPNGKWVAFDTVSEGRTEVRVRSFSDDERQITVAVDACDPLWSPDGRELFYRKPGDRTPRELWAVDVTAAETFEMTGGPRLLFIKSFNAPRPWGFYDVTANGPDGFNFVVSLPTQSPPQPATKINVVLNWFEDLKRMVPTGH